jgi:RNA polymerase sigma factor (sigma-70 family)
MDQPPQELEDAYRTYRPLLFGALARMADNGLVLDLDEGLDLIHDFLLDEYKGLRERFDPIRGRFTTLLFAAFTRYASFRVARLRRWSEGLVGDDGVRHASDATPEEEIPLDEANILRVLSKLERNESALLQARFGAGLSERSLARRMGVSRYAIRKQLVEALGKLAAELGDRGDVPEAEWHIARALWSERRSLDDVAAELGITRERARRAAQRAIARFERAFEKGRL